jgi:3-oxoacyl-[acyl-carrier-protein] synthase II
VERRTVITGLGVLSPNGIGRQSFWQALQHGKSGVKRIVFFDPSDFPTQIAGQVSDFKPEDFIDRKKARRMARFSQFAVACAKMAVCDAHLDRAVLKQKNLSVFLGVSTSAMDLIEKQHKVFLEKGYRHILPFGIIAATPNVGTGEILSELELESSIYTLATGCASGLDAIGLGYREINSGERDMVLAGGVDAPITPLILAGLCSSRIMTTSNEYPEKASRPFDKFRDGGVLSEGGGIIVLEELNSALARKADIYGEVIGCGQSGEIEKSLPGKGLKTAMLKALEDARISKSRIDCISAHAPSDLILDRLETQAIKDVFCERAYRIPVTSIKSMIGNPFGSAGALQIAAGMLTLKENVIPPTINYRNPDPECDLDYTPNTKRFCEVDCLLINSHGFGGSNTSLILKKFSDK